MILKCYEERRWERGREVEMRWGGERLGRGGDGGCRVGEEVRRVVILGKPRWTKIADGRKGRTEVKESKRDEERTDDSGFFRRICSRSCPTRLSHITSQAVRWIRYAIVIFAQTYRSSFAAGIRHATIVLSGEKVDKRQNRGVDKPVKEEK